MAVCLYLRVDISYASVRPQSCYSESFFRPIAGGSDAERLDRRYFVGFFASLRIYIFIILLQNGR